MLKLRKILKQTVFILQGRMTRLLAHFFTVTLIILISVAYSAASQVTLAWDASTSAGAAGYTLHVGTASGSYSQSFDAGNTTSYTVTNLTAGVTYYFSATAYDSAGNTSGYSNEVSTTIPGGTVTTPSTSATSTGIPSGDLNGDGVVNVADALRALQIATGEVSTTPTDLANGDVAPLVNGKPSPDGKITVEDALIILQKAVGAISW